MPKKHKHKPIWHPSLIPSWFAMFFLGLLSLLPLKQKQRVGEKLGRLADKKLKSRTRVARANIAACFPELSDAQQAQLVEATFIACSKGFLESLHAWFRDVSPQVESCVVEGREHLQEAQRRGKGLLMLGGHFSIFDLALPLIASQLNKPGYMYRPNDNPVLDYIIERGRRRHYGIQAFNKRQLKDMLEFLREGGEVWYAADQDFGDKCEVFAPFFGVDAGCITTPSWIARDSGASVIQVSQYRLDKGGYKIVFSPILEDFGQDPQADAEAWNYYLEQAIRQAPAQYLWLHKRFKTRKAGDPPFY